MLKTLHNRVDQSSHHFLAYLVFTVLDGIVTTTLFEYRVQCGLYLTIRCENMELFRRYPLYLFNPDLLTLLSPVNFYLLPDSFFLSLSVNWGDDVGLQKPFEILAYRCLHSSVAFHWNLVYPIISISLGLQSKLAMVYFEFFHESRI